MGIVLALALLGFGYAFSEQIETCGIAVQTPGSGIQVDRVFVIDTAQHPDGFPDITPDTVVEPPYECAFFTNISKKIATTVKFRFAYIDRNGNTLGSDKLIIGGTFAPRVEIAGIPSLFAKGANQCRAFKGETKDGVLTYKGQPVTLRGSVVFVHYSDGVTWRR